MKRIMALDVGDATIGVAVSDLMKITAQGVKTIKRQGINKDLEEIEKIIKEKDVEKIIIGFPKNMNGTVGPQGEKVIKFCEKLKKKVNISIELWDERLTTVAAQRSLLEADISRQKRKKVIDMIAATFILQSYLDMIGNK
ncbi:putative holliday junction resolvase [Alkalithermobacter thermoalcaliphilus JW-YL-7 = DSM 7308]|uniref:Putative pre-16S rRNA nuclease n=1 Tax=Alkalithermobacter thermoalcaliphilus JW-YL-7 = DSM 7308 TaxID=1121328 RepID=A0A150FQR7_CLOPD|nr:Holliday junction resolvase [[Clostridium] paradoxum JW-YL-7 = DSM 7308]SHK76295.1 putative holliday junction resolvase [[Clostridium] paradoxum JW-YL-7 = DSM 7308]